jgi:drug/metabolite transporter (DMT)-like permease
MLWTIAVFLLLCIVLKVQWPTWQQAKQQMIAGLLIHGLYLGGVFAAIKWGMPAGITSIIVGIQPLLTALIGWRLFGENLLPRQWLGLVLGSIGVTVVVASTRLHGNFDLTWPALSAAIIALFAISIGTVYQKRYGAGVNLVAGSLWQYISTAILMGVLAYSFETRVVIWDRQLILALVWLVLGLSVSAILLLMYMIREGEAAKVASYFYLVPAATSIEAWILFGEALPAIAVAGIGVTVAGVYLVVKKP